MSLIDIDTPMGASYVYIHGYMDLDQKSPISSTTIAKTLHYQDIFVNATSPLDYRSIYKSYTSRNITTPLEYESIVQPYRSNRETLIELDIYIPTTQEIK
jgi:hypothetical protein